MIPRIHVYLGLVIVLVVVTATAPVAEGQPNTWTSTPANFTVQQSINIQNQATSYSANSGYYNIGRLDDPTYYNRYRTCLPFSFSSIPQNATINSVSLRLHISNYTAGSAKARILKLSNTYGADQATWQQFDNAGTIYYANLQYDQMFFKDLAPNATLTSDVTNAIGSSNRFLNLGIMSETEGTNSTNATVTVTMTVTWTPKYHIYVVNSFGQGNVAVDGSQYPSGKDFWWDRGSSHNLRAYTQKIGTTTYPFSLTWTNINTGETKTQSSENQSVSISVTGDVTWRANFGQPVVQVTVSQTLSSGVSTGSVGHWEGGPAFVMYTAPQIFPFPRPSTQALLGEQEIRSGEKYNKWVKGSSDEPDVLNHHLFSIQEGFPQLLTSQFKPTYGGMVIRLDLIDLPGNYTDNVSFKDPWLIDYADQAYNNARRNQGMSAPFKNRTSPFSPDLTIPIGGDLYKGVFLDQGGPIDNWASPYYSVGVTASKTLNGYLSNFQNWSVTSGSATLQNANALQTGVVFKGANTTVTALYKGYLISGTTQGFSTNDQRKMIRDQGNVLHLVYESGGSVWYCRSTDNGVTWLNEQRVNANNSRAKTPSISFSNDGVDRIYIVYQSDMYGGVPSPSIVLSQFSNAGQLQWTTQVVGLAAYDYNTNPILASYSSVVFVLYKASSTSGLSGREYWISNGVITNYYDRSVPNTNSNSLNPTICLLPFTGGKYHIAYQQGDTAIQYVDWPMPAASNPPGSTYSVSSGSGCSLNRYPSISQNGGNPLISWTGNTQYGTTAVIRRKVSGNWTSFYKAGGMMNYTNNNSTTSTSSQQAIIGWWNTYGNQTQFIRLVNSNYETIRNLPSPGDIQISEGTDFSKVKCSVFSNGGSAPYRVKPLTYDFNLLSKVGEPDVRYGREAIVGKNGFDFLYYLGDIRLDDKSITFKQRPDTAQISSAQKMNDALITNSFPLTSTSNLTFVNYSYACRPELGGSALGALDRVDFRIELVSAGTGKTAGTHCVTSWTRAEAEKRINQECKLDCSSIIPGEYYFRVVAKTTGSMRYQLADVQYEYIPQLMKRNQEEIDYSGQEVVRETALHQNYPNPFNPSTTFRYELLRTSHVTLRVYDVLGREVATLVNGAESPGYKSVQWDASGVSSGVYFYRIQAGDFVQTKKLLLLH